MKSPPRQIHDDIAFNRVEAFIRGEDNETLVGTEKVEAPKRRKIAKGHGEPMMAATTHEATASAGAAAARD
jgi:hypothetical protein